MGEISAHVIVQRIDDLVTQLDSVKVVALSASSFDKTEIVSNCLDVINTKLNQIRELNDLMAKMVGTSTTSYTHTPKLANKNGDLSG